jgi:hypothetical protein
MVSPVPPGRCLAASWFQMILIKYSNGLVLQGIVLSVGDQSVRVAIKGHDDAAEFRMIHDVWVSEDCEIARLEFAGQVSPVEIHGEDLLEAMLTAVAAALPVQRVM